jgi:hypothetical protein
MSAAGARGPLPVPSFPLVDLDTRGQVFGTALPFLPALLNPLLKCATIYFSFGYILRAFGKAGRGEMIWGR